MKTLVLLALLVTVTVCAGPIRGTSAAFTAASSVPANGVGVDALRKHVSVAPGALATGDADTLAIDLGLVTAPQTFATAFTVSNPTAQPQSVTLALTGAPQVATVAFASTVTAAATLAPGASVAVSVTTSPTVAGRGAGTLRLSLAGSSWLYRDYPLKLDAAPSAPASLTAVARAAGVVRLTWAASATTTNLAGYDVYRSNGGGAYAKLNSATLTATTFDDTSTVDGTTYSYRVRATSSGSPTLTSLDSPTATAVADATAPVLPAAVLLVNGGGTGNAYVNAANAASVTIRVTLPATAVATDTVTLTVSNGAASVNATAASTAGAGTVTFAGLDLSSLGDGTVTFSARATDAAGNVSSARTSTAPKDTVAPSIFTATYVDNKTADHITGTSENGAAIAANQTAPTASGPYTATATGGSFDLTVASSKNVTVTYTLTATDAAGNRSGTTTVTFATKN